MFHIIDDQAYIHEFVSEMLSDLGHESLTFLCPQEYIDFVSGPDFKKPVGVFSDINMPVMNGYEMMKVINGLVPGMRFVVMTGEFGIRSEYAALSCMFLAKPFSHEKVINIVDSLIRCHVFSPGDENRCDQVDDRKKIQIENWSCPNSCDHCSTPLRYEGRLRHAI